MAIGVDIEDINRFEGKSEEFLDRIFTPLELEYCMKYSKPQSHLAVRFCAKEAVYQTIASTITNGLNQIPGISLSPTKELARVNGVDSLGITNLRVRGMWTISSPNKLFENIVNYDETAQFQLFCVMTTKKYKSFPQNDRDNLIAKQGVNISMRVVPDPNNNAKNLGVTIISYTKA